MRGASSRDASTVGTSRVDRRSRNVEIIQANENIVDDVARFIAALIAA
jgi:hypothetical protein